MMVGLGLGRRRERPSGTVRIPFWRGRLRRRLLVRDHHAAAVGVLVRHERDYLERTIATVRNHRDADNCWPQWANIFADEIERCWAMLDENDGPALDNFDGVGLDARYDPDLEFKP